MKVFNPDNGSETVFVYRARPICVANKQNLGNKISRIGKNRKSNLFVFSTLIFSVLKIIVAFNIPQKFHRLPNYSTQNTKRFSHDTFS